MLAFLANLKIGIVFTNNIWKKDVRNRKRTAAKKSQFSKVESNISQENIPSAGQMWYVRRGACRERGTHTMEEQLQARHPNDDVLSDDLNNETAQRLDLSNP